jgi:polar amino acid transport system permease protein
VGFSELLFTGKTAASATKLYFFFFCFTALLFLVLTAVSTAILTLLQRMTERGQVRA